MSVTTTVAAGAPRPGLFILIAMSAIGPIALNIFIPSMPGLQAAFDTDYATVQLTLTFYLASLAVSQLVIGPVSDRFGPASGVSRRHGALYRRQHGLHLRHLHRGPDRRPHPAGGGRMRRHRARPRHHQRPLRARQGSEPDRLRHHGHGGRADDRTSDRRRSRCLGRLAVGLLSGDGSGRGRPGHGLEPAS